MKLMDETYVCDFECNNHEDDCRVWLWDACSISNFSHQGDLSIETFIKWVVEDSNCTRLLFHNLAYDGAFIIDYLARNEQWEYRYKDRNIPQCFTYDMIKDSKGNIYSITLYLDSGVKYDYSKCKHKVGKRRRVEIWDSMKKIPMSVEEIAEAFETTYEKDVIDYNMVRPVGYYPTDKEFEYICRDTQIVAEAINIMYDWGLTRMTIGGDALSHFKSLIPSKYLSRLFPSEISMDRVFDSFVRRAYKGGFCFLSDAKANKVLDGGLVLDVNSMYSYQLKDKLLPFGYPLWFDGMYEYDEEYPLYVVEVSITASLKRDKLPCINTKSNFLYIDNELLEECEDLTLVLTNIDLEMIKRNYNIESIAYYGGYKFRATTGIFDDYIDFWMDVKKDNTGGVRMMSKLMLNNLIGKFGTKFRDYSKVPYIDSDNVINYKKVEAESSGAPLYLPIPTFVNAYARELEIETAVKCGDRLIYCDTDSVHLEGFEVPDGIEVDDRELGKWKKESFFMRGYYVGLKKYIHEMVDEDGVVELDVKCSGLPNKLKSQVTFDNFRHGTVYHGKLQSVRCVGGVVLKETDFTI